MPQIINEKSFAANLGARTGKAAGEALSESVGGIARARINQLLEKELGREGKANEKKALTGILGGDEKLADQFLGIPQSNRYKMLDQFFQSGGLHGAQPGQQQQQAPISGLQPSQVGQQGQPQLGDQLKSALAQTQQQRPTQQPSLTPPGFAQPAQQQFPSAVPQLPTESPLSQGQQKGIQSANQAMQRRPSIGEVLSRPRGKGAQSEKAAAKKLDPAQQEFLKTTEEDATNASKLRPVLKEVIDHVEKNGDKIEWGLLSEYWPTSRLNDSTKKLRNLIADTVVKKTLIESSGQGSNLQRQNIAAAKFNLQQGKDVFLDTAERLLSEINDSSLTSEAAEELRLANGGDYPKDLGNEARKLVTREKGYFNGLSGIEKIQYLFENPNKMGYYSEIEDENGTIILRRDRSGQWKEVA